MQIKLLSFLFFLLTTFSFSSVYAQSTGKKREVGVQFTGLNFDGNNTFGGFYKKQLSENKYRRIRFFTGNLSADVINDEFLFSLSLGAAIGREKRRSLDDRLEFYSGPEISFSVGVQSRTDIDDATSISLSPRFGYVFGLQHSFNERWAINLETIPGIRVGVLLLPGDNYNLSLDAAASNLVSLGAVRKF
ncbi:MAG: hypothetical protein IT262_14310 [Saprospiraceae bacterium]|nr:hypothetical protein [Saprospiraceae bacterium]